MTEIVKATLLVLYPDGTITQVLDVNIRKVKEVYKGIPTGNSINSAVWTSRDEKVKQSNDEEEN